MRRHTVHTRHPRYIVDQYDRGTQNPTRRTRAMTSLDAKQIRDLVEGNGVFRMNLERFLRDKYGQFVGFDFSDPESIAFYIFYKRKAMYRNVAWLYRIDKITMDDNELNYIKTQTAYAAASMKIFKTRVQH